MLVRGSRPAAGDTEAQRVVRRFARGLAPGAAALILTVNRTCW
ncbi:hypothetical protein ACFY2M_37040 [Streptomyces sp. NPDC001276]